MFCIPPKRSLFCSLRMEYFYRDMGRKTGLMMEGDKPAGGQWNFDHDNRKPAPGSVEYC